MSATILGTSGPVEQGISYEFGPTKGVLTNRKTRGTLAKVGPIANDLYRTGWSGVLSQGNGDVWTLDASIGGVEGGDPGVNDGVTETWELNPNRVLKDILESDCALINGLTSKDKTDIQKAIDNPPAEGTDPTFASAHATDMLKVYNLMREGTKSMVVFQPVLRHTLVVPRNLPSALVFANVGKILSNDTMQSTEQMPGDFLIPISTFPSTAPTRTGAPSLIYGWFKCMPTLSISTWARREVHIEYEYGLWASDLYGSAL